MSRVTSRLRWLLPGVAGSAIFASAIVAVYWLNSADGTASQRRLSAQEEAELRVKDTSAEQGAMLADGYVTRQEAESARATAVQCILDTGNLYGVAVTVEPGSPGSGFSWSHSAPSQLAQVMDTAIMGCIERHTADVTRVWAAQNRTNEERAFVRVRDACLEESGVAGLVGGSFDELRDEFDHHAGEYAAGLHCQNLASGSYMIDGSPEQLRDRWAPRDACLADEGYPELIGTTLQGKTAYETMMTFSPNSVESMEEMSPELKAVLRCHLVALSRGELPVAR